MGARVDQPERIVVSGAIDDVEDCRAALRRWLARRAKEAGIDSCVFDRGGYQYHGRVAALAEGAREGGLAF